MDHMQKNHSKWRTPLLRVLSELQRQAQLCKKCVDYREAKLSKEWNTRLGKAFSWKNYSRRIRLASLAWQSAAFPVQYARRPHPRAWLDLARGHVVQHMRANDHGERGAHFCLYIVVYVQKFFMAIKIFKKNNQATQHNQHSSAEVRFVPAKEPGTRAKSRKRYTSPSWAGWC